MEAWLDWARGPAFRFALALLVLGVLRHVFLLVAGIRLAMKRAGDKKLPWKAILKSTVSWLFPARHLGQSPFFSAASVVFHAGVILAPLFLVSHVYLIEQSIGVSWPTLPAILADVLTGAAILGLGTVLVLRVSSRAARALNRPVDLWLPSLLLVPFLSGFLAMHPALNPIPFDAMLLVHVLSGALVLALIPFTKLVHFVSLPATQLVSEVGWHFPPDAGERVAVALGKENQPI